MQRIVDNEADASGRLQAHELAEAKASLRALKAAQVSLNCTQNLAPYSKS